MSDESNGSTSTTPPYMVFSTLTTFADHLRDNVIPTQIDRFVLAKVGGSARPLLISTLKQFGWVEGENNSPTQEFREFIQADKDARKAIIGKKLREVYPLAFAQDVDLATITVAQLEAKIAPETKGDTLRKCYTFFTAAAEYAGIELGQFAKKQRGGKGVRRTRRKSKSEEPDHAEHDARDKSPTNENMVRVPIALTPLRTWYVEIERDHTAKDVERFAKIIEIVLTQEDDIEDES